jgi:hypothetical protein
MTTQPLFPKPPRLATWLMDLFTPLEEESIVGDLFEEHSQLASKSGVKFARRWYWRQTAKTIAHMFGAGFRNAPWSTTATVVGGFLLLRLVSGLPNQLLNVITDRYLMFWSTHFQAYLWILSGMPLAHLIGMLFVGSVVALVSRGREMVATMTLALVLCALVVSAFVWVGLHAADRSIGFAWVLWSCADPLAIAVGGAFVKIRRSRTRTFSAAA